MATTASTPMPVMAQKVERHGVGGRDGGEQVAEHEQRHQPDEDGLAVQAGGGGGQQDRADRDAERVSRDEPAGRGLRDAGSWSES
jgi:hypothetical protein